MPSYNDLTYKIINRAFKVHTQLGPGLLESVYERCLAYELSASGMFIETQKPIPLTYHNLHIDCAYRIDILVENEIIVEVKAADAIIDIHLAQVLTYLKMQNKKLGLILNFNCIDMKMGIKRVINSNSLK